MSDEVSGSLGIDDDLLASVSLVCSDGSRAAGTDGSSVSLVSGHVQLSPVWASDGTAEAVEERQITLGEGPCLDVLATGLPVLVDDLHESGSGPWPAFLREVVDIGVRGLFALPVRIGAIALGTLELYRRRPGPLSAAELGVALTAADALGDVLLGMGERGQSSGVVPHYRLAVHQAAGMITVQLGVPIEEAMLRLRGQAYLEGRPINELAQDVVTGRFRFSEEES